MRDDANAHDIGQVFDRAISGFFQLKSSELFAQTVRAFDAAFDVFRKRCFGIGADAVEHRLNLAHQQLFCFFELRRELAVES